MQIVSYADAKRDFLAVLAMVKEGDVVIQDGDKVLGALVSPETYRRHQQRTSAQANSAGEDTSGSDQAAVDEGV